MTSTRRAAKAFEDFTGRRPRRVTVAQLQDEDAAGWKMGPAVGIAYEATRDGVTAQYFHEFAKGARPDLVARDDGRQLFLTGGKYTVTERGIEDMPELFVVNPSPRRAGAIKRKPMAAARKRNSKGHFVKTSRAAPKRRRPATRQVAVFQTNPAPPKRKRRAATKAAPRRRSYRRNPGPGRALAGIGGLLVPAAGVGAGAVLGEVFMGYLPIPAAWKSGVMRHITKGAVGVGAGWAISKILKQKKLGFYVMAGSIVIATHDAIKEFIAARVPGVPMGQYVASLPSQFGGMGYVNPASAVRLGQYMPAFAGASQAYDGAGGENPDFQA